MTPQTHRKKGRYAHNGRFHLHLGYHRVVFLVNHVFRKTTPLIETSVWPSTASWGLSGSWMDYRKIKRGRTWDSGPGEKLGLSIISRSVSCGFVARFPGGGTSIVVPFSGNPLTSGFSTASRRASLLAFQTA